MSYNGKENAANQATRVGGQAASDALHTRGGPKALRKTVSKGPLEKLDHDNKANTQKQRLRQYQHNGLAANT